MINLLPADEKNAIRKEYRLRVFTVCLVASSFAFTVMIFAFFPTYLFTISRYEAFLAESESDEAQSRLSEVKDMETTVRDTNKKIELLKSGALTTPVNGVLLDLLENKTRGVAITGFSYDSGGMVVKKGKEETISPPTLVIQGRSSDRSELLAFKDALVQKKEFSTVDLPISNLAKDTDLSFSINVSLASMTPTKPK